MLEIGRPENPECVIEWIPESSVEYLKLDAVKRAEHFCGQES